MVQGECKRSRIDLLLASGGLVAKVGTVLYTPCVGSDHHFLACGLSGAGGRRGRDLWAFNAGPLKEEVFCKKMGVVSDAAMM